jgi:hypothetical protein
MKSFIRNKLFLLFISVFFCSVGWSQNIKWPPPEWRDSVHCEQYRRGYICVPSCNGNVILNNGDTIKNCFIRIWGDACDILANQKLEPKTIYGNNIKSIYAYVPLFGNDCTEIRHLPFTFDVDSFWRIVRKKDSIMICDLVGESTFTSFFGVKMVLIEGMGKPIKIYGVYFFSKPTPDSYNKKILKLINKRYSQSFTIEKFKDPIDMLDYILDQERRGQKVSN